MNDVLKDKLRALAGDEVMLRAIRGAFDDRIAKSKPNINKTDDNRVLGERYRAEIHATKLIDEVMIEISSYGDKKVESKKFKKHI